MKKDGSSELLPGDEPAIDSLHNQEIAAGLLILIYIIKGESWEYQWVYFHSSDSILPV